MNANPKCSHCEANYTIKNGKTNDNKQRYKCKACSKTFIRQYSYNAYKTKTNEYIKNLLIEGCGIRSIARLLKISPTTIIRRIKIIAQKIQKPVIMFGKEYELDEICTYVQRKTRMIWIAYAIRKDTREVVDFTIGSRTHNTLKPITETLVLSQAKTIFTDKLQNYRQLIPQEIHCTKPRATNHIERKNLTLRTHLKRLNRRTLCFSKSIAMLAACLRIYFWS